MTSPTLAPPPRRLLVVVEGSFDIEFLKRVSRILHAAEPGLPDLATREAAGQVVFLPAGGGKLEEWGLRLAALGQAEFHLYDREVPPHTQHRQELVAAINQRPGCVAHLTGKRSLENYLDGQAITEACGVTVEVDDDRDIAELVAHQVWVRRTGPPWQMLHPRARRRLRNRVKRLLNTVAVERMTPERLQARDPAGDVRGWLDIVSGLLGG